MADSEFEEFHRPIFEPHQIQTYMSPGQKKNNAHTFYSLIPNDDLEDSPSSKSDASDQEDAGGGDLCCETTKLQRQVEDDEIGDGLKVVSLSSDGSLDTNDSFNSHRHHPLNHQDAIGGLVGIGTGAGTGNTTGTDCVVGSQLLLSPNTAAAIGATQQQQRRRRKLPEIPKNKKSSILHLLGGGYGQTTLADEMNNGRNQSNDNNNAITGNTVNGNLNGLNGGTTVRNNQRSFLTLKCGYLLDEDSSPDSERLQSLGDVDSGHSTAHSPNDFKSMSPQITSPVSQSPFPQPFGGVPFSQLEMLEATHRGLHKFIPRHHDEIEIEIGDAIYVQKEADDLWCEGVNLRTGRQGIFPSAYAVDLDYNEFDPTVQQVKKERYLLGYLGSVETLAHKGTGVVCQAVRKIVGEYGNSPAGQVCILEVSDQGLRMVDRSGPNKKDKKPCIDYFYSLKNVSFCAFHPRDHRFIGFITKHPTVQRFACHVFKGSESTRPVAEAVGRAFQRFYQKFIETAYPIEDIYIE
ncbi:JNK-interacting protein 1 isoform X1 [Bactrocera neohumeralis]|uniref:JNK-interacting protein 1 isoform X1 n=1 Tax=Bactrocera tryoni TaxID=59916 RepID=UPI001A9A211C|nr:JNK-interacting protein 1 isoform X1 [Bactrocera tryoni]XP_050336537.1 JNK-interacting protein 1 isoform X1 [Bactrocera neohumeralis]